MDWRAARGNVHTHQLVSLVSRWSTRGQVRAFEQACSCERGLSCEHVPCLALAGGIASLTPIPSNILINTIDGLRRRIQVQPPVATVLVHVRALVVSPRTGARCWQLHTQMRRDQIWLRAWRGWS